MTKLEEVYVDTLNLLGSDPLGPELQEVVDREHAAADPCFCAELAKRKALLP